MSPAPTPTTATSSRGCHFSQLIESTDAELVLSELLGRYTELCRPKRGRGKLVFVNLQKRLL